MKIYNKLIAIFAVLITLFLCTISILAYRYATDVTSWQIRDNTITQEDLSNDIKVKLVLDNGQAINANIVKPETEVISNVKGISTTDDGYVRIITKDNELVFDSTTLKIGDENLKDDSITGAKIKDNSITGSDIADLSINTSDIADSSINSNKIENGSIGLGETNFRVISSINGITRNGGNIDIIGTNGIDVSTDSQNGKILLNLNTPIIPGTMTNADTLDNLDSTYFLNLGNFQTGELGSQFFSAYNDLSDEDKLNFDADGDLITKAMIENYKLSFKEAIIRENLEIKGDLTVGGNMLFAGSVGYENLILSPKEGTNAIVIQTGDADRFAIDALGNLFTSGNIKLDGILSTSRFDNIDTALINAIENYEQQQAQVNELNDRVSEIRSDLLNFESSTISGFVECLPTSSDAQERCVIQAPVKRTFKSVVVSSQNSKEPTFAFLKTDPRGKTQAEAYIQSLTGGLTSGTKAFYIATLND